MKRGIFAFLLVAVYLLGYYSDDLWARARYEGAKFSMSANGSAGRLVR